MREEGVEIKSVEHVTFLWLKLSDGKKKALRRGLFGFVMISKLQM